MKRTLIHTLQRRECHFRKKKYFKLIKKRKDLCNQQSVVHMSPWVEKWCVPGVSHIRLEGQYPSKDPNPAHWRALEQG